jgi:hypothetical protein
MYVDGLKYFNPIQIKEIHKLGAALVENIYRHQKVVTIVS